MQSQCVVTDNATVAKIGIDAAVQELYDLLPKYFEKRLDWWRIAKDANGKVIGFVLLVTFKEERFCKDGKPQGTIFYMGVLPEFRGHGYALELVHEATLVLLEAGCWQVFCDTGSNNTPMVKAFRDAGYVERKAWQRPPA